MNVTVCSQLMTHVTGVYPICFPHLSGTSWGFSIYAIYAINFNRLRRPTATNTPEKKHHSLHSNDTIIRRQNLKEKKQL
jgi:hypothetical protein